MFEAWKKRRKYRTKLKTEMEALSSEMTRSNLSKDEFLLLKEKYTQLDKVLHPRGFVDANTALTVGGSLLGILAVLHFEKADIITSKAFSMIFKPKIK